MKEKTAQNYLIAPSPVVQLTTRNTSCIKNSYIQQLKQIYQSSHVDKASIIDSLINIFHKCQLHYLYDLYQKMKPQDFKYFVKQLVLVKKDAQEILIQKGKKSNHQLILVQGKVSYYLKSQNEDQQLIYVGTGYHGFSLYPQMFVAPRYANFTIKCQTPCTFLCYSQQIYVKFIKRQYLKQADRLINYLHDIPLFSSINVINLRKYISYFLPKSYKYNQLIYSQGSEMNEIYFITHGQVQMCSKKRQISVKIVKIGQGGCFGLQEPNENATQCGIEKQTHKFSAISCHNQLKLLVLNQYIFNMIKAENIKVTQNSSIFIKQTEKLHISIISRNLKTLDNPTARRSFNKMKCKKKKKDKNTLPNSLTWWGLAQNVKIQHKYKMPNSPKQLKNANNGCSPVDQKQSSPKTLLSHKIDELRKRIIDEQLNQCKQNEQSVCKDIFVPKIKARIRMLEARPKAIDMAEIVKKKLVSYAKNLGSFCDRLNLQ